VHRPRVVEAGEAHNVTDVVLALRQGAHPCHHPAQAFTSSHHQQPLTLDHVVRFRFRFEWVRGQHEQEHDAPDSLIVPICLNSATIVIRTRVTRRVFRMPSPRGRFHPVDALLARTLRWRGRSVCADARLARTLGPRGR